MSKYLITGVTGMVGSHLLDHLVTSQPDSKIIGLCRWRSPLDNIEQHIAAINENKRLSLANADINDFLALQTVFQQHQPDYVFHLAAQSFPQVSFSSPHETLQTNIMGTMNVLEACRQCCPEAKIHICSSSEVFGRVSKEKLPIDEECTFHPASPYAISKVGTDLLGRFYAEAYNMTTVTTRMFTHTGPRRGDVFAESSFAKQIAMIEAEMLPPVIQVGNLHSLRTYADVRDAVKAYALLLHHEPQAGAYYNIGGTHSCSVGDMLDFLLSLSTRKDEIEISVDRQRLRPVDADLQVPNTRKFIEHTGWQPEYTFEQTMNDLLNYWRGKIRTQHHFLQR